MPVDFGQTAQSYRCSRIASSYRCRCENKTVTENLLVIVHSGSNEGREKNEWRITSPHTQQHGNSHAGWRIPGTNPNPHLEIDGRAVQRHIKQGEQDSHYKPLPLPARVGALLELRSDIVGGIAYKLHRRTLSTRNTKPFERAEME